MSQYNSSGRNQYRNYDNAPRRTSDPRGRAPQGYRSSAPQGYRSASQTSRRPAQNTANYRRPQKRRKKGPGAKLYILIAVLVVVLIAAAVVLLPKLVGSDNPQQPVPTPTVNTQVTGSNGNVLISTQATPDPAESAMQASSASAQNQTHYSTLSEWLGDEDSNLQGLSEDEMVKVSDLSINTTLPSEWMNVLLLGTDERTLTESSRTDTMIICSINKNTYEVKLTSIMRDTAVKYDDLGEYNGTYRINAAHYFGGPEYAMKIVNECFDMNIQNYVSVNFYGFRKIIDALGGIDITITEEEMHEINRLQVQQAKQAYEQGIEDRDPTDFKLSTYGDVHLNGRQTLAYARIRKIDSDYSRAERQRLVLKTVAEKLKGRSAVEIISLAKQMMEHVDTNLDINDIATIAVSVLGSGLNNIENFRLPVPNSYVTEERNQQSMLYDCNWDENALQLYNFIYE